MSEHPVWSKDEEDQPSYLGALLTSPLNIHIGLGTLAAGVLLSIPFGLPGIALPLLAFGAGEALAATFIATSVRFRERVDREFRTRRRDRATAHLYDQISRRVVADHPRWNIWKRMRERVASLREIGQHKRSPLGERDLERIEDSGLDFLGLWLAELSMQERRNAVDEVAIERRIADLGQRIDAGASDTKSLRKARGDLEELLLRHRRLASRHAAAEAALLSLPDAVEEIYHAVVTAPASGGGGTRLQEAVERLRLEEELESSYGAELREIAPQAASRMLAGQRH
ncbi:hypothetical protein [Dokdonella sp.]|uniref:hypothetical protein n=1 Tax=Dokdonella sp. TaxID=2291710 RepID=UPI0025C07FE9|nr:hypothetical protein [Dokdonella sp.]MBX3692182.1 hypothetical protein [Dokdonella sp.]